MTAHIINVAWGEAYDETIFLLSCQTHSIPFS